MGTVVAPYKAEGPSSNQYVAVQALSDAPKLEF